MNGQVQYGNTKEWLQQVVKMLRPEGLSSAEGGEDDAFDSAFSSANANSPVVELTKDNFDQVCPNRTNCASLHCSMEGKAQRKSTTRILIRCKKSRRRNMRCCPIHIQMVHANLSFLKNSG